MGPFSGKRFSPKGLFPQQVVFLMGLFPNGRFYQHVFGAFFLFLTASIFARRFSFLFPDAVFPPPVGYFFFSVRGVVPTLVGKQRS